MTKILLIDDSKLILNLLKNSLTNNGYDVVISGSAVEGAEKIISDNLDLVISNINMPEISGLDLLLWSKKNYPGLKFSVMTASATDEIKNFVSKNGAASIYEKGKPTSELLAMVSSTLSDGFYGNLKNINLFDFLNLVSVSKLNKIIVVTDPITDNKGKIYFKSGNIINAEYGVEIGEKAFSDILKIDKGTFTEEPFKEIESFINVPFEFLMINTARILDETSKSISTKSTIEKIKEKINILIVDDDVTLLAMLGRYLKKDSNYIVETAESAILGVEIMQEKSFDVVISDLAMPEVNGLEFLLWIKQNYPQTHVVLISGVNVTKEQRDLANKQGALKFINKPLKYESIKKLIDTLMTNNKFSGTISNISLMDFIQVISMSKSSKVISVKENITNLIANIYINKGILVHASFGKLKGEEAFFKALLIKSGSFSDFDYKDPEEESIKTPLGKLLIRAFSVLQSSTEDETNRNIVASANALFVERSLLQKELVKESEGNLKIYDVGVFCGLTIDKSTKRDVLEKFRSLTHSEHVQGKYIIYNNIGITFIFNDIGILKSIDFYQGFTEKIEDTDISINSYISEVKKSYLSSLGDKGFISSNIAFYTEDKEILTCIRLSNFSTQRDFCMSDECLEKCFSDYFFYRDIITDSIDEEGKFLGFEIFKTSYEEIQGYFITKNIHQEFDSTDVSLLYERLGFSFNFDSSGILEQITFNSNFRNKTLKGLRIGHKIKKALNLYGEPRFKDSDYAIWENIAVFSDDSGEINSISLGAI